MVRRRKRAVSPIAWVVFSATVYQRVYGRSLIVAGIAFNDRTPESAIEARYGASVEISNLVTYPQSSKVTYKQALALALSERAKETLEKSPMVSETVV